MFAKKKRVEITGALLYPLVVGQAAFIKESNGLRRTSAVQSFSQANAGSIKFETENTRYVLRPLSD